MTIFVAKFIKSLMKYNIFIIFFFVFFMHSCKIFIPNRMFKQGNYEYFQVDKEAINGYLINKGDILTLEIFAREGFELIDVLKKQTPSGQSQSNKYSYLVEEDGFAELPLFGRMFVLGYTTNELEDIIELKSKEIFNEPFAILKVINRRAYVFKGSEAEIITLNESPTNLLEVIAKSGGIEEDLKAYKIKLIRGDLSSPEIINVDLSTIEGLRNAELIVQANDIIYIERRFKVASELLSEIAPILTLTTTLTSIILLITNLQK